ncbi:MAG: hypothetical protein R3B84_06370 [Zavarzinella sp.]
MSSTSLVFAAWIAGLNPAAPVVTEPVPAPTQIVASTSNCSSCGAAPINYGMEKGCGCGLISKIKSKFSGICGGCSGCGNACEAPKVVHHVPAKTCTTCKVESCNTCESKVIWYPGMLIHKIKAKVFHKDKCDTCHSAPVVGTTSGNCGTVVIPPTTVVAPTDAPPVQVIPTTPVVPANPKPPVPPVKDPKPKLEPKKTTPSINATPALIHPVRGILPVQTAPGKLPVGNGNPF